MIKQKVAILPALTAEPYYNKACIKAYRLQPTYLPNWRGVTLLEHPIVYL